MSTEQKPTTPPTHTEPKPEPTALAKGLSSGWQRFKRGELLGYKWMAIILLLVAGIGTTWWIMSARRSGESAKWVEWDGLTSVEGLKKFAEENPKSYQGRLARLELARLNLGPNGIDRMFTSSELSPLAKDDEIKRARDIRDEAVKNVEKAREEFAALTDEFKSDPVMRVQCMLASAKAEAALVGVPKEGQLLERRGDPAKAIELLDKVAEAAPETPWGKDSKKLADALRNQNTKDQIVTLQASLFDISPAVPAKWPAGVPKDAAHGWPGQ